MPAIFGARKAIPRILELFQRYEIAATWATVGMLFAENSEDLHSSRPSILPTYTNNTLDPFQDDIEGDEKTCPSHFAGSLIDQIIQTPRQELATHTYSHFYCCEQGATTDAFEADLDMAIQLAARRNIQFESIIFPRNQSNPEFSPILKNKGIRNYRGTEEAWFHRAVTSEKIPIFHRLGRGLDYYVNISGSNTVGWNEVVEADGMCNIRSSRFLRSYSKIRSRWEKMRLQRIVKGLKEAADRRRVFHLWWHPHNFGLNTEENLLFLESVLTQATELREESGLECLTMADIGRRILNEIESKR